MIFPSSSSVTWATAVSSFASIISANLYFDDTCRQHTLLARSGRRRESPLCLDGPTLSPPWRLLTILRLSDPKSFPKYRPTRRAALRALTARLGGSAFVCHTRRQGGRLRGLKLRFIALPLKAPKSHPIHSTPARLLRKTKFSTDNPTRCWFTLEHGGMAEGGKSLDWPLFDFALYHLARTYAPPFAGRKGSV